MERKSGSSDSRPQQDLSSLSAGELLDMQKELEQKLATATTDEEKRSITLELSKVRVTLRT